MAEMNTVSATLSVSRAEAGDGGDAGLHDVAEHAEHRADDQHDRPVQRHQGDADVLASDVLTLPGGVGRCGDAAREGDVGAEHRTEGHVVEEVRTAAGHDDGHTDESHEAGEDEGVQTTDGGPEEAASGRKQKGQEVEHRVDLPCAHVVVATTG